MSAAQLDHARWESTELVLLDIEGTISSISFVKDILPPSPHPNSLRHAPLHSHPLQATQRGRYPYALDRLTSLARDSWSDASFQDLIAGFPAETRTTADALIAHVEDLTRRDVKAVYLKEVQGMFYSLSALPSHFAFRFFPAVVSSRCAAQCRGSWSVRMQAASTMHAL
ncbi:uncharacterized protein EI97DRAFT_130497 [Westerdykella ornata]|uniref:Uncharacterized protein n=1 Tax=Westerdykella ornata TaxID=318751 RepID=A0A6A6JDE4_WESOR|nr:uncharacterized protein EI97DRAFT_130497 [Westerdykella ornata]KAF2274193.1 hypothetical protein EI97DRAFT_130497 [Westerdykella ornata]